MVDGSNNPGEGPTGTGWRPSSTPPPSQPPPVVTPPPATTPQTPPPAEPPQSGKTTLVGEARLSQQRTEHMGQDSSRTIWAFRLERYDANGNRLRPVPVEMRGVAFEGSFSDGDQLRVTGRWRDGTLRADRLENLTTGALVRAKSYKGLMIAVGVVFLVIVGLFAWFAMDANNDFNRNREQIQQQFEQQSEESFEQFCEDAAAAGLSPPQCSG